LVPDSADTTPRRRPEVPLGIRIIDVDPARVVGTMPVTGTRQPAGLLHGGANAVLAETLGSVAANLHAPPGRVAVGVELSYTHHRRPRHRRLHAAAHRPLDVLVRDRHHRRRRPPHVHRAPPDERAVHAIMHA
jgi:uncharacterized protein (TIGR00369 family)